MLNILILDIGGSSMRGVLYDKNGRELVKKQNKYFPEYFPNGNVEQKPDSWKQATIDICRNIADFSRKNNIPINGIGLTAARSSIIPIDKDGKHLSNAIMWQDKRTASICRELEKYNCDVYIKTGAKIESTFTATKILWLKRNKPELYSKAHKIVVIPDFVTNLITGRLVTDSTYGSRTLLMNLETRQWDNELLGIFEIDRDKLCDIVEPGSIVGAVTEEFHNLTGIEKGIPFISNGGDQQCSAIGNGVVSDEKVSITSGTGTYVVSASEKVVLDKEMHLICQASAIPNSYHLEMMMPTTACIYQWFNDNFYGELSKNKVDFEKINNDVKTVEPGANGVSVFTSFQGDFQDSSKKGSIQGVSLGSTRADFARAILESIAFDISDKLELLETLKGKAAENVSVAGGLCKLEIFNQIQSDIINKKIKYNRNGESTAFGAWMSCAVSLGLYDDYESAFQMKDNDIVNFVPDEKRSEIYNNIKKIRNSLK
ncbi:MAG: glycerol kinase [Lentisphaerae bacterium]|nr:glycerol kinase [Lentisphaerota bacterium]MCP4102625.1 glycerol kinase [Lentisphaerota bacterium]